MTEADDRLRALFAADEPPARDPAFSAAVLEALAKQRLRDELLVHAGATLIGGAALWALWPVLQPVLVETSQVLFTTVATLALAAASVWILGGRLGATVGPPR
jgi:hypothetical protein